MQRVLLEFCTGPESKLGSVKYYGDGCICHRITETDDAISEEGIAKAIAIIESTLDGAGLLWGSLPCTAGTPWWNINILKPGGRDLWDSHYVKFVKLPYMVSDETGGKILEQTCF